MTEEKRQELLHYANSIEAMLPAFRNAVRFDDFTSARRKAQDIEYFVLRIAAEFNPDQTHAGDNSGTLHEGSPHDRQEIDLNMRRRAIESAANADGE